MNEGLCRQRRNLMIVCIILWILKDGDVTFSELNIIGLNIKFKNPDAVYQFIWIAYAYFFYRYYQYFSNEGIKSLRLVFNDAFEIKCSPFIRKFVKKEIPSLDNAMLFSYAYWKNNGWKSTIDYTQPDCRDPDYGTSITSKVDLNLNPWILWKGILSAIIDSIFRNSVVTDYLFPFVFAGFIPYYCGSNDWSGSFLRNIF